MTKPIYNYHPVTGEYLPPAPGEELPLGDASPMEEGVVLVPAYATLTPPPEAEADQIAVYKDDAWTLRFDHRGVTVYSKLTGEPRVIDKIGDSASSLNCTRDMRPTVLHKWGLNGWEIDPEAEARIFSNTKQVALHKADPFHSTSLENLVGKPSQTEKDTWALKLEIANVIKENRKPLIFTEPQQAFLDAFGIDIKDEFDEWSAKVLANSAKSSAAIGMAERHRTALKAAIKSAVDATNLKVLTDKLYEQFQEEVVAAQEA